jgi:hypothetical protein
MKASYFSITLIISIYLKVIFCDSDTNTTSKGNTSSNTTNSNTTNNDNITNSSQISISNKTDLFDFEAEFRDCYNLLNPKHLPDCNKISYQFISCCFMNLTYPYQGSSCVPMDKKLALIKQTKFNTFINSNITLPGEIFCESKIAVSLIWMIILTLSIIV